MKKTNPAMAVGLVVRSTERPPFTAWDEAALERMISTSGRGVICSWRDWYASMTRPGCDQDAFTARLSVPLPRITAVSLASVARELTATAHDVIKDQLNSVLQAAIQAVRPGTDPMAMVPIGYFSELNSSVPERWRPFALDRLPDESDWGEVFKVGGRQVFPNKSKPEGIVGEVLGVLRKRVCLPWVTWTGQHLCKGVLLVDLSQDERITHHAMETLALLARKTATALAVAGSTLDHTPFQPCVTPNEFVEALKTRLMGEGPRRAPVIVSLELGPPGGNSQRWSTDGGISHSPAASEWVPPHVLIARPDVAAVPVIHRDAEAWGVSEAVDEDGYWLRVPLRIGLDVVGEIQAYWPDGPPMDVLGPEAYWPDDLPMKILGSKATPAQTSPTWSPALWIRDVIAAWSLWSWSWVGDGGWIRSTLVDIDGERFKWQHELQQPCGVEPPEPPPRARRGRQGRKVHLNPRSPGNQSLEDQVRFILGKSRHTR